MKKLFLSACRLLVQAGYLLLFISNTVYATPDPLPKQPLLFVENKGQVTNLESGIKMDGIDFTTGNSAVKLFIRRDGIHYQFTNPEGKQGNATLYRLDMHLLNANPHSILRKEGETEYTENFYNAATPQGILNVHSFERIVYEDVYPNIDWVLYSNEGGMKYDFIVKPGGNVNDIKIRYTGASQLNLIENGEVVVTTPLGSVTEKAPLVYQGVPANAVASSYHLANDVISFNVSEYDRNQVLVVDPVLLWGTYFGGTDYEVVKSVFVDGSDNMYATGYTYSTMGLGVSGHQNSYGGMADAFIVKYNSNGVKQWSTYYGGSSNDDGAQVKGDASGYIYLVGTTESSSGISTPGSHQATKLGSYKYAFLAKFNGAGVRQWATYYGGTTGDTGANELAVSTDGSTIYFGGETRSSNGIVTNGQPGSSDYKTYLTAFTSQGTRLWGRVLDQTDDDGRIGMVGLALYGSSIYTTTNFSAALWKLNSSDGTTVFNNFIGRKPTGLATDATGRVYVCGNDNSAPKSYLEKYTSTGSREWTKSFGPTTNLNGASDLCNAISISGISIYLSGSAINNGYATPNGNQPTKSSGLDAWVAKFNSNGDQEWGSYIGGTGADHSYAVFAKPSYVVVGGSTASTSGIATNGTSRAGDSDGFLVKFSSTCPSVAQAGAITGTTTVCESSSRVFSVAAVPNATTYQWTVPAGSVITNGQGTTSITVTMGPSSGNIAVTAKNSCSPGTAKTLAVVVNPVAAIPSVIIGPASVNTGTASGYSVSSVAGVTYSWSAGSGGTVTGTSNAVSISWSTGGTKTISVTATNACGTSSSRTLSVNVTSCTIPSQPSVITKNSGFECSGSTASYSVTTVAGVSYTWTVSAGGTISGSGSSATVTWNATTGARTITVTPSNSCGNGTARTLAVTIGSAPTQPSVITGNVIVCTGIGTPYSVTNVAGVTYTWSTGGGGTITGSGNAINVTWTSAGAKTLTVTPSTACGNGTPRTLAVNVNTVPSQPSVIAGGTTVATGSSNQFSVTNEAGVTYAWNAGTGGTVTGSGNSVSISWSSAGLKTITLTPSNGCGNGTARTLNVTAGDCTVPSQPSTITGGATACSGAGATYSVTSVGGVSYAWNAGVDGSVVGSGNSVTLSWSSVGSKTVTVTPFNACGNGTPQTMIVTVSGSPIQPSAISGNLTACKDAATAYSVTNVAGVTYTWDTGGKGTVSGSGNSVNVTWTNLGNNTLVVTPSNVCGNGPTQTLGVVVDKVPNPVGDITGNLSGCANAAIPYSVTNVSGVTYTWNGGPGSSASNTTNNPTITWSSTGSKTLTVTPSNACGNGTGASKTIDISSASAQPSVITGNTSATAGVAEMYAVTPVSGTTYTWNGGVNGTVIGVGNSVQISWSSAGTKTISVTPSNLCGAGTARTLNVTVGSAPCTAPSAPASISGTTSTITGSTVAFTSALVAGATSYTFTVAPATGITIANTGNAHEKNITFADAGTYVVSAAGVNACGAISAPATLTVQICTAPAAQPTGLSSTGVSCRNKVQRYSVNVVDGFTYEWGATNGTITNVANGVADVTWSNAATGQVYVRSVTPCGFSSTYIYGPSETLIANPSAISLTNDLVGGYCNGKVITYTISNPEAGVNYTWVADRAVTTTATTVTATINGPMDIRLFATNVCATNFPLSDISGGNPFPIPTTAPGIISGSLNPVTGELTNYTIPNEGLPFGVRWNFGSGSSDYPAGTTSFQALFGTSGSKTITARYISNASCNVEGPTQTLNVVAVNPCVTPDQPGSISGLASVCANTEYGFSVPFVADVDYTWSAGADATITGTLNNRTIKWTTGGSKTISVTASKTCGTSAARTLSVTVSAPPDQPAALIGSASGCNGATQQISLASPIAGVTYTWEVQGGSVLTSGAQGQIADITWTSLGVNQVKLKPSNSCGNGAPRTLDVTVGTVPDQPSFISGEGEVCSATSKAYSVTNTSGVTYAWNAGSGGTVTGSGNSVSISWSTTGSKTITVTPSNACGNGTTRTLIVNVGGVPAQPSSITGLASPTLGTEEAYAVTSVAGVNYTWSLSDKGTLSASGNNASVFWNTPGGATVSVTPSNTCGNGTTRTASITVNKISQTIAFTVTSPMLANQALTLNGEASSGLPIAYISSNTSVAEIVGNDLIIKEAGTIDLTATQDGDETFASASPVVRSLIINKANQAITFDALTATTFGEESIELTGTTDSGLPVVYSSSNTSVASISGNVLTIAGGGTADITATQGGDAIFNAATPVVRALVVNKADQNISFDPLSAKNVNDPPFILSATASSMLDVTYSSSNTSVATVSGNTVTLVGEGTTTITASQAGNTNYSAATPVEQTLEVNGKEAQTITFASLSSKTFGDADFSLSATASSNLAVSYTSSNTNVATVSGSTVSIVGVGSTIITASQAGDATFNPANAVQQTLVVNKADQSISFSALENKLLSSGSFELAASASSSLPVTYTSSNTNVATVSGTTVTLVSAGTTTITASQAGNENYNEAIPVEQVLTVTDKQAQSITFNSLSAKTFGDATVELSASASSGLAVSYESSNTSVATVSGSALTIVGAGSVTITATQSGNSEFEAAPSVEQVLVVNKATQTITFTLPTTANFSSGSVNLVATSNAGLPISFASSDAAVASITGNTLTIVAPGAVEITASQAGNANVNAASSVTASITIVDDRPTIVLSGSLDFGDVLQNETAERTLTITNNGNGVLNVSTIAVPVGFTASTSSVTVNAQSSTTVTISFTPTEIKKYSGSVVVVSNAPGGPKEILVSGEGTTITGFNEPGQPAGELDVYPNPGKGLYALKGKMSNGKLVSITDLSGRSQERRLLSLDEETHQLDITDLPEGVYYIKVEEKGSIAVKRIIKLN